MADASFTVVADLPVWSTDARALAGDVLGVLESGHQKRGRFWAIFLLRSYLRPGICVLVTVCTEMVAVPETLITDDRSLCPTYLGSYAGKCSQWDGLCLQDALKTQRHEAKRAVVFPTLQTYICYISQLLQHVRKNSPSIPHINTTTSCSAMLHTVTSTPQSFCDCQSGTTSEIWYTTRLPKYWDIAGVLSAGNRIPACAAKPTPTASTPG